MSRALRGHQLVDLALNTILLQEIFESMEVDLDLIQNMLSDAMKGELDVENISAKAIIQDIDKALSVKKHLLNENRTASLRLQYMKLNDII